MAAVVVGAVVGGGGAGRVVVGAVVVAAVVVGSVVETVDAVVETVAEETDGTLRLAGGGAAGLSVPRVSANARPAPAISSATARPMSGTTAFRFRRGGLGTTRVALCAEHHRRCRLLAAQQGEERRAVRRAFARVLAQRRGDDRGESRRDARAEGGDRWRHVVAMHAYELHRVRSM